MTLRLIVETYGTLIPDVRSIVFNEERYPSRHTLGAHHVFSIDDYLRNGQDPTPGDAVVSLIHAMYEDRPVDDALVQLLHRIVLRGGTIQTVCATPILREMYEKIPSIWLPAHGRHADRSTDEIESTQRITVSRRMNTIERALLAGEQAIHYESAYRLQRELELRHLFVADTTKTYNVTEGGRG